MQTTLLIFSSFDFVLHSETPSKYHNKQKGKKFVKNLRWKVNDQCQIKTKLKCPENVGQVCIYQTSLQ